MAKIVTNAKGFKVIKLDYNEFLSTGGLSICDGCSRLMSEGYYIPVLNSSYCEKDYKEWLERAIRYDEDLSYEEMKFKEMKRFFNINEII